MPVSIVKKLITKAPEYLAYFKYDNGISIEKLDCVNKKSSSHTLFKR